MSSPTSSSAGPSRGPGASQGPLAPLMQAISHLRVTYGPRDPQRGPLEPEGTEGSEEAGRGQEPAPRAALETHAAARGHRSVAAWLRALRPNQLDRTALCLLVKALGDLSGNEQAALADLLLAFAPRFSDATAEDSRLFHPSLLDAPPLLAAQEDEVLLVPYTIAKLLGSSSR
jgi:hypothetical protein